MRKGISIMSSLMTSFSFRIVVDKGPGTGVNEAHPVEYGIGVEWELASSKVAAVGVLSPSQTNINFRS